MSITLSLYTLRPKKISAQLPNIQSPTITPTPTPFVFNSFIPPKIDKKDVYKIAMVGDSMTAALGPHGGGMSEYMNDLYKKEGGSQAIIIDNYAVSSNILSVNKQLDEKLTISEYTFGPLITSDYDLILVESYGYNPLSDFGIEEGIKKQNEQLKVLMEKLITKMPRTAIIFVTTIAPNIENYARSTQPDNTTAGRKNQAEERISYLKNHNEFAIAHNIPLINIYEKTLTANGDGNTKYINANDDIHPSFQGIEFIGSEIGNYIYDNQILPH